MHFTVNISRDLELELQSLANLDAVAPKMINAGLDIVEPELMRRAAAHQVTGEMLASIRRTEPAQKNGGYSGAVRPTGTGRKGVRNMEKMAFMEYGTSHQRATPIIAPTIDATETRVLDVMEQVFNREVGGK